MARSVKRPRAEPQAFHQLGKQGRKTGMVLQDRGERDEHGMQPIDSIFSPHEAKPPSSDDDSDDSGGADMSIASSAGPGPQTLLKNLQKRKFPIPKSKSPIKTHLNSPAKRNPHLEHLSSPSRSGMPDIDDATVTRKIDFAAHSSKPKRPSGRDLLNGVGVKPTRPSIRYSDVDKTDPPTDPTLGNNDPTMSDMVEQSMQLVSAMHSDNFTGAGFDHRPDDLPPADGGDDFPEDEPRLPSIKPSPVKVSPVKASPVQNPSRVAPPMPSIFGSKKRSPLQEVVEEDEPERVEDRPEKRQRTSMPPPPRPIKAPLVPKAKPPLPKPDNKPVKRGRGRPRKTERPPPKRTDDEEEDGDETFMEIQRAPPMPRARGLVSVRNDGGSITQARSGRRAVQSFVCRRGERVVLDEESVVCRRGERVVLDEEDTEMNGQSINDHPDDFRLPGIREVLRVPEDAPPSRRAPRSKTRTKAKATVRQAVEEDEELEDWEINEGEVTGDIVLWEPDHEFNPPGDNDQVQVTEDQLAISADAIQTKDINEATFRFAKTLTMPFMGAGVVDLPPSAEKRPKNSRKMHMVFFVHYGKVLVTINEARFRISAGGTWFVPRGNYYSILNDYEVPARIFFAQACEVAPPMAEE